MPSAKRSAAAELAADPDATQSVERHPQKKQKGAIADVAAPSKPAPAAKKATKKASGGATESKTKEVVVEKKTKTKKDAVAKKKKKKEEKTTTRKPRIAFTQQSRQPGKRAVDDKRPRRAVKLIDDEAEDDDDEEEEEDDEDFDEEAAAAEEEDEAGDDDDDEEEDEVVNNEGGLAEVDEDDEDDNATVAISNPRNGDDDDEEEVEDAKLMSSTRPRQRANAVRGDPGLAAARRIAAIEFDSESDAEAAAAAAAPSKGKRKKATDGESVATVEKNAAKSKRRAAEMEPVANDGADFDMVAVLQKNAKKFKLVPDTDGAELSTTNVRKHVERKVRGGGESTKMVYRLLHLDETRRCAYTKAELMKPNTDKQLRIDMYNFLHFAAVVNGKYKMEDVMSFLVDKNGMMCACPRRTLLTLLYLDHGRNYAQFRVFYDQLPKYIDDNTDDKVPPVPPALYTSGEIRKSKRKLSLRRRLLVHCGCAASCPTIKKMSEWTQSFGGGDDDDDVVAATDMQSVVPATEFDGDDARSVATSKHPKAAASSRRSRAAARPPATTSASFGVYTNVDLANPAYRGLNLVSRSYGAGTQLPLATFIGNPMARLVLEFGPMCPTEQHAVYFAHVIRSQLAANGPVIDEMIRDVSGPPAAAAAAAAAPEQDE
jgi:hypothetical protein